ncbi:hypothetical protein E2974_09030 [Paracoccus yeei]|uniref:hypothetical protein n=1 Tax=Paracoccus yeei TaxID=147645 RepID=UPI003BF8A86E
MSIPPQQLTLQEAIYYLENRINSMQLALGVIAADLSRSDDSGITKLRFMSSLEIVSKHLRESGKDAGDIDNILNMLEDGEEPPPSSPRLTIVSG